MENKKSRTKVLHICKKSRLSKEDGEQYIDRQKTSSKDS